VSSYIGLIVYLSVSIGLPIHRETFMVQLQLLDENTIIASVEITDGKGTGPCVPQREG
jgi:hypothetical protein